eukprot:gb/GECG01002812.1/.p1 GENE.gb/GECG01002812.1/~~gb/GECG01002812.1/.p1  ORF type:complete len:782 (+),score=71.83 gb/GECG01002812.1/:1-2346(+)
MSHSHSSSRGSRRRSSGSIVAPQGPVVGIIGGSSLLHLQDTAVSASPKEQEIAQTLGKARVEDVETPMGRVVYRTCVIKANERSQEEEVNLVFTQRHEANAGERYTQPADINYSAIAIALKHLGCTHVVGICSVGSLKSGLALGTVLLPDDYYCPYDTRPVHADHRGHFMPKIDGDLHKHLLQALGSLNIGVHAGGVYVNSRGPRFETKAEVRMFAEAGDVIGMTGAHEASACQEVGLPYAMVSVVDNYAHGISTDFSVADFKKAQATNLPKIFQIIGSVVPKLASLSYARFQEIKRYKEVEQSTDGSTGRSESKIETVDLIVHAHYVVPVKPENKALENHCVVVREGRIVDVLPSADVSERYQAHRTVRLSHHALIPGLINAHTHLALNNMRGLADDKPLMEWLTMDIWPAEARLLSPLYTSHGTRFAAAECIRSGVTTVNDMHFFGGTVAEELYEVGLRARVGAVCIEFPTSDSQNAEECLDKAVELCSYWKKRDPTGRIQFSIAPHAPYTVSEKSFLRVKELAERFDVPIHLHLHETESETRESSEGIDGPSKHLSDNKCRPFENLDKLGLITSRMIAVHMTQLTEEEIARVAETGCNIVHCPSSNMKLASGFSPIWELEKAGVNVAIGTDSSASNNSLDMFGEMKLAAILAKGVSKDATAAPAFNVLKMATLNGAKALGLEKDTGSLEIGKFADMTAVRLDGLEQMPLYNVISHLVYAMDRHCVTDVWVAGTQLLAGRHLLTIDERKLKHDMKEWAYKVRLGEKTEVDYDDEGDEQG